MQNLSHQWDYYTTDELQKLFSKTDFNPVRWFKNTLNETEKDVLCLREKNRLYLQSIGWTPKTESILQYSSKASSVEFLIPTLNTPDLFNKYLKLDLKSALIAVCENLSNSDFINKVITEAVLTSEQNRFFCVMQNGGFVIHGNNQPKIGNLLFLAHEVGHGLYELEHKGGELGSEVYAFQFEDFVAKRVLSLIELKEWEQFKRDQDALNFQLAFKELEEFKTGESLRPQGHLFFRESLVTCWGYQYINCMASLKRARFTLN